MDEAIAVVVYSWNGEVITDGVTNVLDPSEFETWSLSNTEFAEAATLHGNAIVIVGNIRGPGGGKKPVILRLRFDADPFSGRFILSPDESFGDTQSACPGGQYSVVAGCRLFEFNRSNFNESRLYAVDIDSHNRIIVAGVLYAEEYLSGYHQSYYGIARLTPNGDLDTAFNQGGVQVVNFGYIGPKSLARSVVVDRYDRITVGGWTTTYADPYTPQFALLRLLSHGTPDPTFGNGTNFFSWGRVTTNLMCRSGEEVSTIALDEKYAIGRIIAAGRTGGGPMYCFSTVR